eukprot:CAMPEP_0197452758 /NCGR_PEP_ID=MMETSP1175-20131217/32910_1 /TAXON_ID=1003142 /ORGANISM="Triceratium dubium, Strain CCMP147" /LENGTH=382 /DNA_ID=CAMNT_0042985835 /DNA_START=16 /DNA_END=1164 /DNA_ORIENTATION=-
MPMKMKLSSFPLLAAAIVSCSSSLFLTAQGEPLQGAQATFDAVLEMIELSSLETTQDVTAAAAWYTKQAVNFAGGNYGDADLITQVIGLVEAAKFNLTTACGGVGGDDTSAAACEEEVTETMDAAVTKLTVMHNVDIEQDMIILFGQYWRPNACLGGTSFGAPPYGNPQCWNVPKNYSIHGIWPSSSNVREFPNPTNCSMPDDLKMEDVPEELEPSLNEDWISYYPKWNNFQFWQWEWYKHGSCWDRTKQDFIQQALTWHGMYDIPAILQAEGFAQGVMINKTLMLERLTANMWGANLGLLCIGDGKYVDQFFACFDYSGKNPVDCPSSSQCKDNVMLRVYHETDVPNGTAPMDDSGAAHHGYGLWLVVTLGCTSFVMSLFL